MECIILSICHSSASPARAIAKLYQYDTIDSIILPQLIPLATEYHARVDRFRNDFTQGFIGPSKTLDLYYLYYRYLQLYGTK